MPADFKPRVDVTSFAIFPGDGQRSAVIPAGDTYVDLRTGEVRSPGRGKRNLSACVRDDQGNAIAHSIYIESDRRVVLWTAGDANAIPIEANDPTTITCITSRVKIVATADTNIFLVFSPLFYPLSVVWREGAGGASSPSILVQGRRLIAVGGTAIQLGTGGCNTVSVRALLANVGTVYVGNAAVTAANGLELAAGESVTISIDSLAKVFVNGPNAGDGITALASGRDPTASIP